MTLTRRGKFFEARYTLHLDEDVLVELPGDRKGTVTPAYVQKVTFRVEVTRDGALGSVTLVYKKIKKDGTPYTNVTTGTWRQYRNDTPLPRDWWPQWLTDAYNAALADTLATVQGIDFTVDTEV